MLTTSNTLQTSQTQTPTTTQQHSFATFNKSEFPLICVRLGHLRNRDDFTRFLTDWENCNVAPESPPYYFLFDTSNLRGANLRYSFQMTRFIIHLKDLQRQGQQSLQASIIVVTNSYIRYLLKFIFKIQRPVADVYLVRDTEVAHMVYLMLKNNQSVSLHSELQILRVARDSSV